jgi:beta-N-acetylhexosaminidase
VLDLYDKPDSTIIGDRSMGSDPNKAGRLGVSYVEGASRGGIIPVVKHFPGHGSTTLDSHGWLPRVDLGLDELMERDFEPFRVAIQSGAEALMTAHILFTQIDPVYPVTLSRKILVDLLRGELGYRGVVISDGMAMGALANNFPITETLKLLFKAEVDLILVHGVYDLLGLKQKVGELYQRGEITEADIDVGLRRALLLKARHGLLPPLEQTSYGEASLEPK